MPINTSLLIAAPMLQDYLVDNSSGLPLANGVISLYQDNSRTTFKNWYYQTGTPGNYTYITLPNPMTLSSVGTITDGNGNDVIPFYYPYSEIDNFTAQPYYITVVNSNGQQQFTRQNFPFNPDTSPLSTEVDTLDNLIVNSVFWRNIGSVILTNLLTNRDTSLLSATICPSQHDGYIMPDMQFIKNANGAVDVISFENFVQNFPDQVLPNGVTPEFYLNFNCSGTGSETVKYIQIPIQLHVNSLSGVQASFVLYAMGVTGSPKIEINLYQFLGTGTSSSPITIQTIDLNNNWEKYVVSFVIPSTQDIVLGQGGDDAYFMQIGLPTGSNGICDINIAMPSFYLSNQVPTNDFQTYDQVNSIISSPRTCDFRTSVNNFQPGWVSANDGTIGNIASSATNRANTDTWVLYSYLWNHCSNTFCPVVGGKGSSAYSDFTSNKPLTLTRTLGRALLGGNPSFFESTTYTASTITSILTLGFSFSGLTVGTPIFVENSGGSIPSPLQADTVYFVSINSLTANTIKLSTTLENAHAGIDITILSSGSGFNGIGPALGAYVGESTHTQTIAEMPSHNHPGSTSTPPSGYRGGTSGSGIIAASDNTGSISLTIASQGGGSPFNVIQPSTYQNVFIKL